MNELCHAESIRDHLRIARVRERSSATPARVGWGARVGKGGESWRGVKVVENRRGDVWAVAVRDPFGTLRAVGAPKGASSLELWGVGCLSSPGGCGARLANWRLTLVGQVGQAFGVQSAGKRAHGHEGGPGPSVWTLLYSSPPRTYILLPSLIICSSSRSGAGLPQGHGRRGPPIPPGVSLASLGWGRCKARFGDGCLAQWGRVGAGLGCSGDQWRSSASSVGVAPLVDIMPFAPLPLPPAERRRAHRAEDF